MNLKPLLLTTALIAAGLTFSTAQAATVTANMPVQITIQNACVISVAPTLLQFGTHGVLAANIDSTSTMSVTCTTGALYDIGLNAGLNGAGDINARKMNNGTNMVAYQLYSEATRTTVWGDTVGANTVNSTGTGIAQPYTVYGRVPGPQTTPPAGVYDDTVLVTVTF